MKTVRIKYKPYGTVSNGQNSHYKGSQRTENRTDFLFKESVTKNFLNLRKKLNTQIKEVHKAPKRRNLSICTRHVIINTVKVKEKERILKVTQQSNESYIREIP